MKKLLLAFLFLGALGCAVQKPVAPLPVCPPIALPTDAHKVYTPLPAPPQDANGVFQVPQWYMDAVRDEIASLKAVRNELVAGVEAYNNSYKETPDAGKTR